MADNKLVHIVDDEESIRRSLDFLLRSAGFRTERWEDGEAFLKGADKTQSACVLLDVRMPGMDGLQVQAEMHGAPGEPVRRAREDVGQAQKQPEKAGAEDRGGLQAAEIHHGRTGQAPGISRRSHVSPTRPSS